MVAECFTTWRPRLTLHRTVHGSVLTAGGARQRQRRQHWVVALAVKNGEWWPLGCAAGGITMVGITPRKKPWLVITYQVGVSAHPSSHAGDSSWFMVFINGG